MLYVARRNGSEHTWHVGEVIPHTWDNYKFQDVSEIQADCNELDYIRKNFVNIPDCPTSLHMKWTGDIAQFIYDNLR